MGQTAHHRHGDNFAQLDMLHRTRNGAVTYTVRWAEFVKKAGFPDWGENRSNAMRHSFGSYH